MNSTPTNQLEESANKDQEDIKLSPDEVQSIRAILEKDVSGRIDSFTPPELPITETDKDAFAESLLSGTPFRESFERYNGKLSMTFRTKLKWEEDLIVDQIRKDFEDKVIENGGQYANRLRTYNLCFQLEELDKVKSKAIVKGTDLRQYVAESIFENMPDQKLYILLTILSQFDNKVTSLCRLAVPDFSKPDAAS